jgi:hypothetical protein
LGKLALQDQHPVFNLIPERFGLDRILIVGNFNKDVHHPIPRKGVGFFLINLVIAEKGILLLF